MEMLFIMIRKNDEYKENSLKLHPRFIFIAYFIFADRRCATSTIMELMWWIRIVRKKLIEEMVFLDI